MLLLLLLVLMKLSMMLSKMVRVMLWKTLGVRMLEGACSLRRDRILSQLSVLKAQQVRLRDYRSISQRTR